MRYCRYDNRYANHDNVVHLTDSENDAIRMCCLLFKIANFFNVILNLYEVYLIHEKSKKVSPTILMQLLLYLLILARVF